MSRSARTESRLFSTSKLVRSMRSCWMSICRASAAPPLRRPAPRLQILMLTVRDREMDKVEALDAGADDYITKPFSIPELVARLRSAVRRSAAAEIDTG